MRKNICVSVEGGVGGVGETRAESIPPRRVVARNLSRTAGYGGDRGSAGFASSRAAHQISVCSMGRCACTRSPNALTCTAGLVLACRAGARPPPAGRGEPGGVEKPSERDATLRWRRRQPHWWRARCRIASTSARARGEKAAASPRVSQPSSVQSAPRRRRQPELRRRRQARVFCLCPSSQAQA